MQVLVDTNVVLRVAEPEHAHHLQAVAATEALRQSGHILCIVPQVHYEFWVAVTRPVARNGLGMTAIEAEEELRKLGPPLFRFMRDERAIYGPWHGLVCDYAVQGKQSHDARLVAAMLRHNLTHLLTFNVRDFQRYREIEVVDASKIPTI
jgi:predicted nucleic acid-binding protein